jgi:hypothetical protein
MPPSPLVRVMQAGAAGCAAALYLDERGMLRTWRWQHLNVKMTAPLADLQLKVSMQHPALMSRAPKAGVFGCFDFRPEGGRGVRARPPGRSTLQLVTVHSGCLQLRFKARPPPIGCTAWPAGRVLLEWAVREVPTTGSTILEFGSGIGTTSLGLALAARAAHENRAGGAPSTIIATDICSRSLETLLENAASNGIPVADAGCSRAALLRVGQWDASEGEAAVGRLRSELGLCTFKMRQDSAPCRIGRANARLLARSACAVIALFVCSVYCSIRLSFEMTSPFSTQGSTQRISRMCWEET